MESSSDLLKVIKSVIGDSKIEQSKSMLLLRNKDRTTLQEKVEKFLKSKKISFKPLKKPTELSIQGFPQKLVFKPLKAKGAGGLKFEQQFVNDFNNWFQGCEEDDLDHGDTIKAVLEVMNFKQSAKNFCTSIGKANTKRPPTFTASNVTVTNNLKGNVADVSFTVDGKVTYASLKYTNSFYIYNATVIDYFLSKDDKVRKTINDFFGFDGTLMAKGFGKDYFADTVKNPNFNSIKTRLADLIKQALGPDILLITKVKKDTNFVNYINGFNHKVKITDLNKDSYLYAEKGVRKYCVVKTAAIINGHHYNVDFQFRGTTAIDVGPRYLRILLKVTEV